MRRLWPLLFVVACTKHEAPPAQKVAPSVAQQAAPVIAAPLDPEVVIADLVFDGEDLIRCDEIVSHESKRAGINDLKEKAAKAKNREIIVERSCVEATSDKPYQGRCVAGRLSTFYYSHDAIKRSDALMKECLEAGGVWDRNKSREAQRDALERDVAKFNP